MFDWFLSMFGGIRIRCSYATSKSGIHEKWNRENRFEHTERRARAKKGACTKISPWSCIAFEYKLIFFACLPLRLSLLLCAWPDCVHVYWVPMCFRSIARINWLDIIWLSFLCWLCVCIFFSVSARCWCCLVYFTAVLGRCVRRCRGNEVLWLDRNSPFGH